MGGEGPLPRIFSDSSARRGRATFLACTLGAVTLTQVGGRTHLVEFVGADDVTGEGTRNVDSRRLRWAERAEVASRPPAEMWPRGGERLTHCGLGGSSRSESVVVGRIESGEHEWSGFSCGVAELDGWMRDEALAADRRRGSRVRGATVSGRVVGSVQLSALQVEACSDVPAWRENGRCRRRLVRC
jgi:hypothetical protein